MGEITAGDGTAFAAAANGEGAHTLSSAKLDSGALEGAHAQQGEVDIETIQPFQVGPLFFAALTSGALLLSPTTVSRLRVSLCIS